MKLTKIDKVFGDNPTAKKVAYMIATSHEYKTPNEEGAIKLVSNYKWTEKRMKVDKLQGINKPVNYEKVFAIAKNLKEDKLTPFMVVDKFQGITPQSPNHKILLDGHHRQKACKLRGVSEVPVYYGTYTGGAEKTIDELIEKKADEIVDDFLSRVAEKRYKFKQLKKYQVELTSEEKKIAREKKAVWSGNTLAVWKAEMPDGEVVYVSHTHRAFNTAPTLNGIISRFHNFIKSTS